VRAKRPAGSLRAAGALTSAFDGSSAAALAEAAMHNRTSHRPSSVPAAVSEPGRIPSLAPQTTLAIRTRRRRDLPVSGQRRFRQAQPDLLVRLSPNVTQR
jgi:hypothetical protein